MATAAGTFFVQRVAAARSKRHPRRFTWWLWAAARHSLGEKAGSPSSQPPPRVTDSRLHASPTPPTCQVGWNSDLLWVSVDDRAAFGKFEDLFRRMRLPEHFASVVPHSATLRLYSAFFVVRTCCDAPNWHTVRLRLARPSAIV